MGLQNHGQNSNSSHAISAGFRTRSRPPVGNTEITTEKKVSLRLAELKALDENRLEAQQNLELYRHRMSKAFNKRVRPRSFQKRDLVLAIRTRLIIGKKKGKLEPNWKGPFAVKKVYLNGAYLLITMEVDRIIPPTNACFLEKSYL